MYGVPYLLLSSYFIIILACLFQTNEGGPVSNQQQERFKQKVERKLSNAETRLKAIRRKRNRFFKSHNKADEEGISDNNTNRKKWLETDKKHEKANDNINRHLLGAKLLGKEVPVIGDILTHRAHELKEKSQKYQDRKDKLKRKGKEDTYFNAINYHDYSSKRNKFTRKEEKYKKMIRTHTAFLSDYNQTGNKQVEKSKSVEI